MNTKMILAIASLVFLAGCAREPEPKPSRAEAAPVRVHTVEAVSADLPGVYEATGTVQAKAATAIAARMTGYVREVKAALGDRVSEGQTLVTIDAREAETAIRRAEAARAEVRSAIPEADAGVAAAKANADLAQATFARMQELFNKKSISNQEFDEASARLKAAQANQEMARAKRTQLDSKLMQIEEEIRAAQINLGFADVKAPFAGTITSKTVEPGTLALPGVPLFTIEREGGYRLEAAVEESHLSQIRVGQSVPVQIDSGRRATGRVTEIVPSVDAAARTGTVRIDLPAMSGLRSGVFGRAAFPEPARKAILVPANALQMRGQVESVYVVESGIAHARLVTTGVRQADSVELLSGVVPGEHVVAPVPPDLMDGSRAEVQP